MGNRNTPIATVADAPFQARAASSRRAIAVAAAVALVALSPTSARSAGVAFQGTYARALILVGKGDLAGALNAFESALRLEPGRNDLRLRAAALEIKLGRLNAAARRLRQVLRREADHPEASRELGALLLLQGKAKAAARLLLAIVKKRPNDTSARSYLGLAQRVVSQQDATRPTPPAQSRSWSLAVTLGSVYDSNVSLLPDLSGDLPLPPGVNLVGSNAALTSAAAGRLYTEIAVEGRPIRGRHGLALGAGLYQSKHLPGEVSGSFEPPYFDLTSVGGYLTYTFTTRAGRRPLRLEVSAGHVEYFLDAFRSPRHYLQRPWGRIGLGVGLTPWLSLRVAYRFAAENYFAQDAEGTGDDRDGFEHAGSVDLLLAAHRRLNLRLSLGAGIFGADGDQWDALFTYVGVDARLRLLSWLSLSAGLDYLHRGYSNSSYVTTSVDLQSRAVERVDDRVSAFGRVRFDLWRFHVSLVYAAQKNNSSARQLFGYARQIAGLEMGFRY